MRGGAGERPELADIELRLLLEAIFHSYGLDFRNYAPASMRRRVQSRVEAEKLSSISSLQEKVLHDPECMERLLLSLTIHVTSMFRDPSFYLAFRDKVVPLLKALPFVRIWHAGCSTGEEVYSMAILIREEGLSGRCRLYATDLSDAVIKQAKDGVFPLSSMKENTENYQRAGGMASSFSEYYTAKFDHALMKPSLKENIVFAEHNLVTDGSFNEFNVILCRNVMIYFNKTLQERVHGLLFDSLSLSGILALGRKESLQFTPYEKHYEELDGNERLYRKV